MTDTTDIKALRSKAANVIGLLTADSLTGSFALDSLADVFDDMFRLLEAERQRADANDAEWRAQEERAEKAEEELAALKGEQVSVSAAHKVLGEVQLEVLKGLKHHKGWQPRCGWVWGNTARTLKIMDALLKKDLVSKGMNELFAINKNGLAAIEAAGGIVSTSDERLMQDMSGIVMDGE